MAIVKGNSTEASTATSISFSHTQNSGADGLIFCAFYYYNSQALTNVQYDGVAMTELTTFNTAPSVLLGSKPSVRNVYLLNIFADHSV